MSLPALVSASEGMTDPYLIVPSSHYPPFCQSPACSKNLHLDLTSYKDKNDKTFVQKKGFHAHDSVYARISLIVENRLVFQFLFIDYIYRNNSQGSQSQTENPTTCALGRVYVMADQAFSFRHLEAVTAMNLFFPKVLADLIFHYANLAETYASEMLDLLSQANPTEEFSPFPIGGYTFRRVNTDLSATSDGTYPIVVRGSIRQNECSALLLSLIQFLKTPRRN